MKLVQSSGGAFEVSVDGALIFSKLETGRHVKKGEVVQLIERIGKTSTSEDS